MWLLSRVGSTSKLAPDWLHKSEQLIRSQDSKLTKLLTLTKTQKFPLQVLDSAIQQTSELNLAAASSAMETEEPASQVGMK